MPTPDPFIVIAIFKAIPGNEVALLTLQKQMVTDTLAEEGCLRYELNQSLDDPTLTLVTEQWATEQSWKNHMEGSAIRRFQAAGAKNLFTSLTLHRMTKVTG